MGQSFLKKVADAADGKATPSSRKITEKLAPIADFFKESKERISDKGLTGDDWQSNLKRYLESKDCEDMYPTISKLLRSELKVRVTDSIATSNRIKELEAIVDTLTKRVEFQDGLVLRLRQHVSDVVDKDDDEIEEDSATDDDESEDYKFEQKPDDEDSAFNPDVLQISLVEEDENLTLTIEAPESYKENTIGVHLSTDQNVEVEIETKDEDLTAEVENDKSGEVNVENVAPEEMDLEELSDSADPKAAFKAFLKSLNEWMNDGTTSLVAAARETGSKELVRLASYLEVNGYLGDAYEDMVEPLKALAKQYGVKAPSLALLKDSVKIPDKAGDAKDQFIALISAIKEIRQGTTSEATVQILTGIATSTEDPVIRMVLKELLDQGSIDESVFQIMSSRFYLYKDLFGLTYEDINFDVRPICTEKMACDALPTAPYPVPNGLTLPAADMNLTPDQFDTAYIFKQELTDSAAPAEVDDKKKLKELGINEETGQVTIKYDDDKEEVLMPLAGDEPSDAAAINAEAAKIRSEQGDEAAIKYINEHYASVADTALNLIKDNKLGFFGGPALYKRKLSSDIWVMNPKLKVTDAIDMLAPIMAFDAINFLKAHIKDSKTQIMLSSKPILDDDFNEISEREITDRGCVKSLGTVLNFVVC